MYSTSLVEEAGGLPLGRSTGRDGQLFQAKYVKYMHICIQGVRMLYYVAILCMGLPITTTIASKLLNSLIFHDNTKHLYHNLEILTAMNFKVS